MSLDKDNLFEVQVIREKDLYSAISKNKAIMELAEKLKVNTDIRKLICMIAEETLKFHNLIKKKKKDLKEKTCFRCQEKGHLAKNCIKQVICKFCGKNHWSRLCPETVCQDCKRHHKTGQCRAKDEYCKWYKKFKLGHNSKNCPYAMPLKRIMKMEKVIIKTRSKSNGRFRFRGRFKKFKFKFKK